MARDHYVAKTYLKHFAGSDGMLRAYRKSDGARFPCRPGDVCHEWNGDLIEDFLCDPTALAKYRKFFEPAWNPAIKEWPLAAFPEKASSPSQDTGQTFLRSLRLVAASI